MALHGYHAKVHISVGLLGISSILLQSVQNIALQIIEAQGMLDYNSTCTRSKEHIVKNV